MGSNKESEEDSSSSESLSSYSFRGLSLRSQVLDDLSSSYLSQGSDTVSTRSHETSGPDSPTSSGEVQSGEGGPLAGSKATELWGVFIGDDWQQDPRTAGDCIPTISVQLPKSGDGLLFMREVCGKYPAFRTCLVETVDRGSWAALGCIPGSELHQPQWKKVLRMHPLNTVKARQNARYAIVYVSSSQKGPLHLPAVPELVLPLPNTQHAGTVLEQLQKAKPQHRFKLLLGSAHGEDVEWGLMDTMMKVPQGSLHVWASPVGEELEDEEVLVLPAKPSRSAIAENRSVLLRRRRIQS